MKRFAPLLVIFLLVGCASHANDTNTQEENPPTQSQQRESNPPQPPVNMTPAAESKNAMSEQERQLFDRLEASQGDAQALWYSLVEPKQPSKNDFAGLLQATGVTFQDASPRPVSMDHEHVERAVRLLATTIVLGAGNPPSEAKIDYRLEFVGLKTPQNVILSINAAYFNGKVYYRPGLADWLGTNMHADPGH